MAERERLSWLDSMKCWGILLVLLSHSCGIPYVGQYFFASFVQLFFVISGYTLKKTEKFSVFVKKRVRGLLFPYFVYSIIIVTISIFYQQTFQREEIGRAYLGILYSRYQLFPSIAETNVFFLKHNTAPLWFVSALFVSGLLSYPYLMIRQKWAKMGLIVLYGLLSWAGTQLPILLPWSFDSAFLGAILMIAGYEVSRLQVEQKRIPKWLRLIFYVLMLLIYYVAVKYQGSINMSLREYGGYGAGSILNFVILGVAGFLIAKPIFVFLDRFRIMEKVAIVGKNTFLVLAIHPLIYKLVKNEVLEGRVKNGYIVGMIQIIAVLLVTILVYRFKLQIQKRGEV